MKKEKLFDNRGFSLVEVIIAMAILAIISIPLLSYFTDSMKYNVKMRSKQQATMCAQEVVEQLKSEQMKLVRQDGGGNYTVPYLAGSGYVQIPSGTVLTPDPAGGVTGYVTLTKDVGQFTVDAKVTVGTSDAALGNPIVSGVNDVTDVFALESGQIEEAISFYLGKYNTADESGAASPAPVTEEDIRTALTQTYLIDVSWDSVKSKNKVTVTVTYDFNGDTYTAAPIMTESLANVGKIYLLYNKIEKPAGSEDLADAVEFHTYNSVDPADKQPEIILVCQNQIAGKVMAGSGTNYVNSAYRLNVSGMINNQKLRSNISNAGTPQTGELIQSGFVTPVEALTDNKAPNRLVEIEVTVYPKGDRTKPYTVVTTTKGE